MASTTKKIGDVTVLIMTRKVPVGRRGNWKMKTTYSVDGKSITASQYDKLVQDALPVVEITRCTNCGVVREYKHKRLTHNYCSDCRSRGDDILEQLPLDEDESC